MCMVEYHLMQINHFIPASEYSINPRRISISYPLPYKIGQKGMTNRERIQKRIERDKLRKARKKAERQMLCGSFEEIYTTEKLFHSMMKCKRNVSWKASVQYFYKHGVSKIRRIKHGLDQGKLVTSQSAKRIVLYERGKRRVINAICFDDRVVQRVGCDNVLLPMMEPSLVYDNVASLPGKGVNFARKRLDKFLDEAVHRYGDDFYVLTFDFKGFFDSIQHRICLEELNHHFNDKRIVGLNMRIIKMYQESVIKSIEDEDYVERNKTMKALKSNNGTGITLGSQVSQVMALIVPNRIDHYIKDKLGIKWYVRYMDDGVLIHKNKEFLQDAIDKIDELAASIGLKLNMKKTKIQKSTIGFKFMKVRYQVKQCVVLKTLDKSGIKRMRRKLKKYKGLVERGKMNLDDVYNSMQSWISHATIARSYKTVMKMIERHINLFGEYRAKELSDLWKKNTTKLSATKNSLALQPVKICANISLNMTSF